MKRIMQTKFTTPDQAVHGNCLAACVASLIECELSEVPAFEDCPSDGSWFPSLWDFLHERGFECQGSYYVKPGEPWPDVSEIGNGVKGFFIASGPSPRTHVTRGHSVIYSVGGIMSHDPHPSNEGILSVRDILLIEPISTACPTCGGTELVAPFDPQDEPEPCPDCT